MFRICSVASGSKGNCTFVTNGVNHLIVDLGISARRIDAFFADNGVTFDKIDLLITHTHSDHIKGVEKFCLKHDCEVFCGENSAKELAYKTGIKPIVADESFSVSDFDVRSFSVPHDSPCVGYVIRYAASSCGIVTDVGAIKPKVLNELSTCDVVMIEANHDLKMLAANRAYPADLKRRITSAHGHLSNDDCADACGFLADKGVKKFILAHLSQENNDPSIARSAVLKAVKSVNSDATVVVASQDEPTEFIDVC